MPLEDFDNEQQLKILQSLAEDFPYLMPEDKLLEYCSEKPESFLFNLFYLWDHKMVYCVGDPSARDIRITAKGIDYLNEVKGPKKASRKPRTRTP